MLVTSCLHHEFIHILYFYYFTIIILLINDAKWKFPISLPADFLFEEGEGGGGVGGGGVGGGGGGGGGGGFAAGGKKLYFII